MWEIIKTSLEFHNLGLNALTISAAGNIFFSVIKSYGIGNQAWRIWRNRSGDSVSPVFFAYNFFLFLVCLLYGLEKKSLAITVSGSLCLFYLPILIGLLKYRRLSRLEIGAIILMAAFASTTAIFPKDAVMASFPVLAAPAAFAQAREIWLKKDFGNFSRKYLQTFFLGVLFWDVYYFAIHNWLLMTMDIGETVLIALALILEAYWRKNPKRLPA